MKVFEKEYCEEASNAPTQPAQVHQQSDPAGIMQMVDTLIASVNEAHHASSEGGATQPFASRLEEIRATPAGWYDDENPAPSPAAVEAMRFLLVDVSMQPVPLPHLYPLPSGGIAAEWTIGAWEASAEVNETGSQVTLNAVTALTEQGAGEVVSDPYDDAVQKDRIDRIIARMNDMMTNYRNSQHERNKKDEHITLPSPYGPFVKFELQHKSDDDWRSFAVFYTGEATQGEIRGYGSSPELALEQIKQRYLDRDNWVYYGYSEYPV